MKNISWREFLIYAVVGVLAFLLSNALIKIKEKNVQIIELNENGIKAKLYAQKSTVNAPTVILIGGGEWGDQWAGEIAERGYTALSIPYYGLAGLPKNPEEIPLEYFREAISSIKKMKAVDSTHILTMGASRNAELALLIASTMNNDISGVVAIAPSAVVWSNRVLPFNSDVLKASWRYENKDIPYLPMEKIKPQKGEYIETIPYWLRGLQKLKTHPEAAIKVERISGPILLFSGLDDQVWPSTRMADMIEDRLKRKGFDHYYENNQYKDAGHLISRNVATVNQDRFGVLNINNEPVKFDFGGTITGDKKAIVEIEKKVFELLRRMAEKN